MVDYTGKIVVLNPLHYNKYEYLLFRVSGGWGASDKYMGSAVFGNFLCDNEYARISAYNIWREATEEEIKNNCVSVDSIIELLKKSEIEKGNLNITLEFIKEVNSYEAINEIDNIEPFPDDPNYKKEIEKLCKKWNVDIR